MQLFQPICWKDFLPLNYLGTLSENKLTLYQILCSVPLVCICVLIPIPHLLAYCSCIVSLEITSLDLQSLAILGLLYWWDCKMIQTLLKKSVAVSYQITYILTIRPSNSSCIYLSEMKAYVCSQINLYVNVHSSIILNSQNLETT